MDRGVQAEGFKAKVCLNIATWNMYTDALRGPIMALVAGLQAVRRRIMGHAGAYKGDHYSGSAEAKIRSFEDAGVVMTDHPAKFGEAMRLLLNTDLKTRPVKSIERPPASRYSAPYAAAPRRYDIFQSRSIYSSAHLLKSTIPRSYLPIAKRGMHLVGWRALELLTSLGIPKALTSNSVKGEPSKRTT